MPIGVFCADGGKPSISKTWVRQLVKRFENDYNVRVRLLNVVFMQDEEHTKMNGDYLGHQYATDVITFSLGGGLAIEGEIYINEEEAGRNANGLNLTKEDELRRLVVHGLLHLVGWRDDTRAMRDRMSQEEDKYLNSFM